MSHAARGITFTAVSLASVLAVGCQPVDSPAAFVVEGEPGIKGIAVDALDLYFVRDDGHLKKVSLGGGKPTELASGIDHPVAIALDKDSVYWITADRKVGSVPKNGGSPSSLVDGDPGQVALHALAVGSDVYFGSSSAVLESVPKSGGAPFALIGDATEPTALFAHDGGAFLYAMNGQGELLQVDTFGKGSSVMASEQGGTTGIAADSSFVYWVNPTPSDTDPSSSQPRGKVYRMRSDGSDLVTIAFEQEDPFRVVGDEKNVYWTDKTGTVSAAPVDGSAGASPLSLLQSAIDDPMSSPKDREVYLAQDATTLYWARSQEGTITALPKPTGLTQ